jgi:3-oxoacyl-(acyl-carrier-protein) synthase
MSLRLAGLGWVTPLGNQLESVWENLLAGAEAESAPVTSSLGVKPDYRIFPVPADAVAEAARLPRLRRSSAISRFAVVAGLRALRDAGITLDEASAGRTALVLAVSNGGVIYTKRFYHEIVQSGAAAASPLLFPETVFNAPASHLAAILGITGASYTIVGDGAVAMLALRMAEDLMTNSKLDRCLVVAAEEADWLLCDAYSKWRLLRRDPPVEPFARPPRGMILSEGAGAVVLAPGGAIKLERVDPGGNFNRRSELLQQLDAICARLGDEPVDLMIASANGTFIDDAERAVARKHFPDAAVYTPKPALGESVAAGGIWQVVCGALALRAQQLPPLLHFSEESGLRIGRHSSEKPWRRAVVTSCGLNQQVGACVLSA